MPTNYRVHDFTQNEIDRLADRLFNRALSKLATETPQQRADLFQAAALLRAFAPDTPAKGIRAKIFTPSR